MIGPAYADPPELHDIEDILQYNGKPLSTATKIEMTIRYRVTARNFSALAKMEMDLEVCL